MVRHQQIIENPALLGGDDDSAIMDDFEEKFIDSRPEPWVFFFKYKASCEIFAERLRSTVANNSFHGLQRLTVVTVSIGVSQSGRDGDTIEAILRVADQRLYHAKHQGRNCVITTIQTSLQPLP